MGGTSRPLHPRGMGPTPCLDPRNKPVIAGADAQIPFSLVQQSLELYFQMNFARKSRKKISQKNNQILPLLNDS